MKKLLLFSKILLVAAALGVGSSVWADEDCTGSVSASGWLNKDGNTASTTATNFAPAVAAGQMYEVYETTRATTGILLHQTVTGLTNGVYQVELYANAMYTSDRTIDGDGDESTAMVYLFANGQTVKINAVAASSTNANGEYTLRNVVVTDGTLKLGLIKNVAGTNWHNIQIKSLTLLSNVATTWESYVSNATALSPVDVSFFIQNNEFEVDGAPSGMQHAATGWNKCSSITNYRPLAITSFSNTSNAFTGGYAYENWHSDGLGGQISQSISNIPNGKYNVNLGAFVGSLNGQFVYGKSNGITFKTNMTAENATEDCSVDVVVTDNTLEIGLDMNNAGVQWAAVDNAHLQYYGTALINDAVAFVNGATMTADQWYYFDATVAGTYEFAAQTSLSNITYTTDGTQVTSSATGSTPTASESLSANRYYFKSSSDQILTITVPTGASIVNADIDFSNAIIDGTVAGTVNSMKCASTYVLGYTSGEPATTVLGEVLRVGKGSSYVTIPDAQYAGTRDEVVITFDFYFVKHSGRSTGFYLYDNAATPVKIAAFMENFYDGNASENTFNFDITKITNAGTSNNNAIYYAANRTTFELHLDYTTKTMYAKQYTNGELKQTTANVSLGSNNPLKKIEIYSSHETGNRSCWFDNLRIYTIKGDYSISEVGYTVRFVDGNGTTVKDDDTSREAVPGTAISDLATSADKATFYNDGDKANNNTVEFTLATNKYVYRSVSAKNSSDEEIDDLEDGAIITIVYDKYNKYNYAISQKLGTDDATELQAASLWQDQTLTYYYPICVKSGDNYYITKANATTPNYGLTITKDNTTQTINYAYDAAIVNYVEAENMGTTSNSQKPSLSSKGTSWCLSGSGPLTTTWNIVANGYYDIEVGMTQRDNYTVNIAPKLKNGESETELENIRVTSGNYVTKTYHNQLVEAGRELTFANDNNTGVSKWALDYVILRNAPTTVSKTITAAGWATYCSPYALDFTSTIANLTNAYIITGGENSVVTLTPVTSTVPAGTGLLLKGNGECAIPVVASSDTDMSANKLVGTTTELTLAAEQGYVLMKEDTGIGFYLNANEFTVGANTAYLPVGFDGGDARASFFSFSDETTGISQVENGKTNTGNVFYNLNGQRINKPVKGLYMMDGKKFISK